MARATTSAQAGVRLMVGCLAAGGGLGPSDAEQGASTTTPATVDSAGSSVPVVKVVDGDTLDVERPDGSVERVRIIGINTPESSECFSPDATNELERLVGDRSVELVTDHSDRDQYGRLLRYVER